MRKWHLFVRQPLHLVLLLVLCGGLWLAGLIPGMRVTHSRQVTAGTVASVSVAIGVLHQLWVLVFWRLELGYSAISRRFGDSGFKLYSVGFFVLIAARLASIIYIAPLNRGTLPVPLAYRLAAIAIIAVFSLWGMYSVLRFFGIRRALGLDHFDPAVRYQGLVTSGAYRYTGNVMYLLVLPVFCVPGLLWGSLASTFLGIFHYAYVWVHYYCTELPDMSVIYGERE